MATDLASIPGCRVDWRPVHRIVPSRFPPVAPWDRIAHPDDFEALAELEGLTNPRLREELRALSQVPRSRWVSGPGTTPIMAAFTHLNPEGSRFSDGSFGVFYAAREIETALRETVFHRERFLARTREPPMQVQMRCYATVLDCRLHDIRGGFSALHDPADYTASQHAARALRAANSNGIVYDSVRNPGGHCAAVFWPDCVAPCKQAGHYAYCWDGRKITDVIELTSVPF